MRSSLRIFTKKFSELIPLILRHSARRRYVSAFDVIRHLIVVFFQITKCFQQRRSRRRYNAADIRICQCKQQPQIKRLHRPAVEYQFSGAGERTRLFLGISNTGGFVSQLVLEISQYAPKQRIIINLICGFLIRSDAFGQQEHASLSLKHPAGKFNLCFKTLLRNRDSLRRSHAAVFDRISDNRIKEQNVRLPDSSHQFYHRSIEVVIRLRNLLRINLGGSDGIESPVLSEFGLLVVPEYLVQYAFGVIA